MEKQVTNESLRKSKLEYHVTQMLLMTFVFLIFFQETMKKLFSDQQTINILIIKLEQGSGSLLWSGNNHVKY